MAKAKESRCSVCGALLGPGNRFCSHFCKISDRNDKAKAARKTTGKNKKE